MTRSDVNIFVPNLVFMFFIMLALVSTISGFYGLQPLLAQGFRIDYNFALYASLLFCGGVAAVALYVGGCMYKAFNK